MPGTAAKQIATFLETKGYLTKQLPYADDPTSF